MTDDRSRRPATNRGLALLSVLWVVVLLSVIAVGVLHTGRTDVQLTGNLIEASRAELLANGAVEVALVGLATPVSGGGWRADGTTYGWRAAGGDVRVRVTEEAGKIDLNEAPVELLAALFQAAGVDATDARKLAARIQDFRDADGLPSPGGGAEDRDYRLAGASTGAKDAPFSTIDELQQVLGMSPALFRRVSDAITVYSGQSTPNGATAPALVRDALMLEDPDQPPELLPQAEQTPGFDLPVQSAQPTELTPAVATDDRGLYDERFLIRSEARLDGGARFVREAIAAPGFGAPAAPYVILRWRAEPAP